MSVYFFPIGEKLNINLPELKNTFEDYRFTRVPHGFQFQFDTIGGIYQNDGDYIPFNFFINEKGWIEFTCYTNHHNQNSVHMETLSHNLHDFLFKNPYKLTNNISNFFDQDKIIVQFILRNLDESICLDGIIQCWNNWREEKGVLDYHRNSQLKYPTMDFSPVTIQDINDLPKHIEQILTQVKNMYQMRPEWENRRSFNIANLPESIETIVDQNASYIFNLKESGYCIRCWEKIPYNKSHPYCLEDFKIWAQFGNRDYKEKYCHRCGIGYSSTINYPFCDDCYKIYGN